MRTPAALAAFADEVADETLDLVCIALTSASNGQAGNLGDLLKQLADTARERVELRLRIGAQRAKVRAHVRAVVVIVLIAIVGMVLFARSYLTAYSSPAGQLVLAAVGAIFAGSFAWMGRISKPAVAKRLLTRSSREAGV